MQTDAEHVAKNN